MLKMSNDRPESALEWSQQTLKPECGSINRIQIQTLFIHPTPGNPSKRGVGGFALALQCLTVLETLFGATQQGANFGSSAVCDPGPGV